MYRHARTLFGLLLLLMLPALACGVGDNDPTATAPPASPTTPAAVASPTSPPAATVPPAPTEAPLPTEPPLPEAEGSLAYGDTVSGVVPDGAASAWRFIGVAGERVDVTVAPAGDGVDVVVDVLDSTGQSILAGGPVDASFATEEIVDLAIPTNDEYTIVVTGFDDTGGPYELSLNETRTASPAGPQAITVGDTLDAFLDAGQTDVYTYASPDGAPVTLVVDPEGDLDVVIELYGPGGGLTQTEDSSFGREEVSFTPPTGGNQVIYVRGFEDGDSGNYTISLTSAPASGVGDSGSTLFATDTLETTDEEIFYPFYSVSGETTSIVVEPVGDLDVVVEVWRSSDTDTLLDSADQSLGKEEMTFTAPETGAYYFKVVGFENATGTYDVTLIGSPDTLLEVTTGDVIDGVLGPDGFIEYSLRRDPGQGVSLHVECDDTMDAVIEVYDLDDNLLAEVDDGFSGETEQLLFTAPDTGEEAIFLIRVRDFTNSSGGTFTLLVQPS